MTWAPPKVSLSDRINQQQSKIIESEFQRGRRDQVWERYEKWGGRRAAKEQEWVCV